MPGNRAGVWFSTRSPSMSHPSGSRCIYYGTEQAFNGAGTVTGTCVNVCSAVSSVPDSGAAGRHCFHEQLFVYAELARILESPSRKIALRRGRQYLREISGNRMDFGLPEMVGGEIRSIVPWSRILDRSGNRLRPQHPL